MGTPNATTAIAACITGVFVMAMSPRCSIFGFRHHQLLHDDARRMVNAPVGVKNTSGCEAYALLSS
jgi:hypothetical protein